MFYLFRVRSTRGSLRKTILLTGFVAFASTAGAVPMIDFGVDLSSPGTLVYNGNGGEFGGISIGVNSLTASGTGHDGTLSCIGCSINFVTGNLTSSSQGGWVFGASGSSFLSLTGSLDTNGDGVGDLALDMTASFIGQPMVINVYQWAPYSFGVAAGLFLAEHNTAFSDYFGVSGISAGGMMLFWGGYADSARGLIGGTSFGLIRSFFQQQAVPEPASTSLVIGALLAMTAMAARRRRG